MTVTLAVLLHFWNLFSCRAIWVAMQWCLIFALVANKRTEHPVCWMFIDLLKACCQQETSWCLPTVCFCQSKLKCRMGHGPMLNSVIVAHPTDSHCDSVTTCLTFVVSKRLADSHWHYSSTSYKLRTGWTYESWFALPPRWRKRHQMNWRWVCGTNKSNARWLAWCLIVCPHYYLRKNEFFNTIQDGESGLRKFLYWCYVHSEFIR